MSLGNTDDTVSLDIAVKRTEVSVAWPLKYNG